MNVFDLMAAPFAECLVLVAIHTYLGIHVLKRRVIFVDLALAQIAALGTTVGFLFGIMPETSGSLLFSMAFAFAGAAVFSVTRFRDERVPQEAIIGLSYAIACAVAVLVVEKTQGAEHLKDILVGNLLWVKWSEVATAALIYALVGVVHYVFRKQFLLISEDPDRAYAQGLSVRGWDFLFYTTFGVVIAISTRVAGVLLVFVFLVAPAVLAFIITSRVQLQLLIGWGLGTAVTVSGLFLSWHLDLPSGPAVIAFYGVALVVGAIAVYLWRAPNPAGAFRSVLAGTAVAAVVALGLLGLGRALGASSLAVSEEAHQVEHEVLHDQAVVTDREKREQDEKRRALQEKIGRCAGPGKIDRYLELAGPEERVQHARNKLAEDRRRGLEFLLIALADDDLPLLYREEGNELLTQAVEDTAGYDPDLDAAGNRAAIERLCSRVQAMKHGEGERR